MENNKPSLGILAEYETPEGLMAAAEKVRDGGYKRWDTHTPFPVHGIDDAMGIKPTILPWIVLCAGAAGTATALLLQWWTNGVDYPFQISGKPLFSWVPAFPVTFELTVLFAGITTLLAMLALNRLPRLHNPLFDLERFARATQDRFFIAIDAKDPLFNEASAKALLAGTGAEAIEDVPDLGASDKLPAWIWQTAVVLVFLSFIPLGIIVKARYNITDKPAIHLVPDMDYQYSYRTGEHVPFFEDGRAMRPELEGTVAVEDLEEDDVYYRGKSGGVSTVLSPLPATPELMARGQQRFNIYCAPCHGESGYGDGMVHRRAMAGAGEAGGWVPPTNLTKDFLIKQPDGDLFNTITHGVRSMPAYGPQITVEDRWAIVLYLRALQRAANATEADVPAAELGALKK
jgi:mono/diheme cytochrome c family protein